jgi:hypothetical protein
MVVRGVLLAYRGVLPNTVLFPPRCRCRRGGASIERRPRFTVSNQLFHPSI